MNKLFGALTGACRAMARGISALWNPLARVRYIVVDLEWNQYPRWVRTPVSREGISMPHEIIQIGAVKVDGLFRVVDTLCLNVCLQGRRKLSKHVARVIHKTQADIDQGMDFPVAYARFSHWSADASRFITWGTDDFRVFENNLAYYRMSGPDPAMWHDAQMIYARRIRGDRVQTSLETAAQTLGVNAELALHDALNDAYITVGVCKRLKMDLGMLQSAATRTKPKAKSENLLFMQKKFVSAGSESGFETRALAKQHVAALPVGCPSCGAAMRLDPALASSGDRWMRLGVCKAHGCHLVRYRVRHRKAGDFTWTRAVYAPDAELERYFRDKAARGGGHRRGGRRRRGKKPGAQSASPQDV